MYWILALIISICSLIWGLLKFITGNKDYWSKKGIHQINEHEMPSMFERLTGKKDFAQVDAAYYKNTKDHKFAGVVLFRTPSVFITDLEIIKSVLVKDFEHFVNRRTFGMDPIFEKMLINMKNQEWKDMRSIMSPTFSSGKIKQMFQIFLECSEQFVSHLQEKSAEGKPIEMREIFSRFTMDVIASAAYGLNTNTIKNPEDIFAQMGKKHQKMSFVRFGKLLTIFLFPKLSSLLRLSFSEIESRNFFIGVLRKAIKHRETSKERRSDFLQLMLDAKAGELKTEKYEVLDAYEKDAELKPYNKTERTFEIDEDRIVAQSFLFFLGGFDTTEGLLDFACYEMAIHPELQSKLFDEVNCAVEKNQGKLSYDIVNNLQYLDQFISETLRLFSPATRTERMSTQDYKFPNSDFVLPKDTLITIPIYSIHRDPEYYPDPEKFDPDRFTPENKAKRSHYAYLPFGHGPRNCIGMRFALIESKTVLANLILNFEVEPSEKMDVPIKVSVRTGIMKPQNGVWVKLIPRMK